MFQNARLRVGTVQQRNLGQSHTFAFELLYLFDDEPGLIHIGRGLIHAQFLAALLGSPQVLAETLAVAADQRIGCIENIAVRAIVLFQLDEALDMKITQQILHVARIGAAKRVDGLIVVAHCK